MRRRQRVTGAVVLLAAALTLAGTAGSNAKPPASDPAEQITYEGYVIYGGVKHPMSTTAPQPSPYRRAEPESQPSRR